MKKCLMGAVLGLSFLAAMQAQARNVKYMLPIANVTEAQAASLDASVKLFFGPQKTPAVLQKITTANTTDKASIAGGTDAAACQAAFLSALQNLQKNAKAAGANAVVNIESLFRHSETHSATEFECHAGGHSVVVTLQGDVVKIADK
jgi:uncharacterized protein YbjQ (UPF0145 family)